MQTFLIKHWEKMEEWPWEQVGQFFVLGLLSLVLALKPFVSSLVIDEIHLVFYAFLLFLASLYRPLWVASFLVALIPFETSNLLTEEVSFSLRPYQLVTFVLLLALAVQWSTKKIRWPFFHLSLVDFGFLGVWLGTGLACLGAMNQSLALKSWIILSSYLGLYVLLRYFLSQREVRKPLFFAGLWGAVLALVIALGQSVVFVLGGEAHMVMDGRPNGSFFEADWLGFFVGLVFLVMMGLVWWGMRQKYIRRQPLFAFGIGLFLLLAGVVLILTVARSAWLGVFVATFIYGVGSIYFVVRKWWRPRLVYVTALSVGGISLFAAATVWVTGLTRFDITNRLTSTATGEQRITVACNQAVLLPEKIGELAELSAYGCQHIRLEERDRFRAEGYAIQEVNRADPNFDVRETIYVKSVDILRRHWLLGIGGGNSGLILGTDERGASLNASNLFLETWLGSGVVGLLSLLSLVVFLGYTLIRQVIIGSEKHLLGLGLLAHLLIFNFFNAGMFLGIFFVLFAYLTMLTLEEANTVNLQNDFKVL